MKRIIILALFALGCNKRSDANLIEGKDAVEYAREHGMIGVYYSAGDRYDFEIGTLKSELTMKDSFFFPIRIKTRGDTAFIDVYSKSNDVWFKDKFHYFYKGKMYDGVEGNRYKMKFKKRENEAYEL